MQKEAVIALRDALQNEGKHRAVKVAFDNGIMVSLASDLVVWDDDKEIMIAFVSDSDSGAFGADLPIRIICSTYENIQFIMANTNVKINARQQLNNENLETVINNLSSAVSITDEQKTTIINWFSKLYSGKHELSHNAYLPGDLTRGKKEVLVKGSGPTASGPTIEEEEGEL